MICGVITTITSLFSTLFEYDLNKFPKIGILCKNGIFLTPSEFLLLIKQPTIKGDLLIFPSTLVHSVDQHKKVEKRYTLSFNAFPCGLIGFPEESAGIDLKVL